MKKKKKIVLHPKNWFITRLNELNIDIYFGLDILK